MLVESLYISKVLINMVPHRCLTKAIRLFGITNNITEFLDGSIKMWKTYFIWIVVVLRGEI